MIDHRSRTSSIFKLNWKNVFENFLRFHCATTLFDRSMVMSRVVILRCWSQIERQWRHLSWPPQLRHQRTSDSFDTFIVSPHLTSVKTFATSNWPKRKQTDDEDWSWNSDEERSRFLSLSLLDQDQFDVFISSSWVNQHEDSNAIDSVVDRLVFLLISNR